MVLKGKRGQLVFKQTNLRSRAYGATTSVRLVVFHVVVFHCPQEMTNTVKWQTRYVAQGTFPSKSNSFARDGLVGIAAGRAGVGRKQIIAKSGLKSTKIKAVYFKCCMLFFSASLWQIYRKNDRCQRGKQILACKLIRWIAGVSNIQHRLARPSSWVHWGDNRSSAPWCLENGALGIIRLVARQIKNYAHPVKAHKQRRKDWTDLTRKVEERKIHSRAHTKITTNETNFDDFQSYEVTTHEESRRHQVSKLFS